MRVTSAGQPLVGAAGGLLSARSRSEGTAPKALWGDNSITQPPVNKTSARELGLGWWGFFFQPVVSVSLLCCRDPGSLVAGCRGGRCTDRAHRWSLRLREIILFNSTCAFLGMRV